MVEDAKETLCFKSKNTSQIAVNIMKDLVSRIIYIVIIYYLIFFIS